MSEYFQEDKRAFTLLAILFFVLAIVLFFVLLRPLLVEVKSKENNVVETKDEIEELERQIDALTTEAEEVDVEQMKLYNKIPQEKDLDSYITWLQKLEAVTDTKIERIQFVYDSEVDIPEEETEEDDESESSDDVEDELAETELAEDEEESGDKEAESDDETETSEPVMDEEIINERPEGLEVIVVNITGHAKEYKHFIKLLETIESEERISLVSRINFSQPTDDDLTFSDNPNIALSFNIDLTTFYYPE